MYFIALIIFFIIVSLISSCSMIGVGGVVYLLDFVSLFSILLLSLPMLVVTGLTRDFFRSFSIAFSKTCTADKREITRSLTAVKMASRLLLLSGIISSLLGLVSMLHTVADPAYIGPSLSVALLSLLYSMLLMVMLLPVRTRLELMEHSCE